MIWKTKGKSAWALILPDALEYDFLPLSKILGSSALEVLFNLNLQWQKDIFSFIKENFSATIHHDFFIYLQVNQNDSKKKVEKFIKKEFHNFKIKLCKNIPKLPNTLNIKEKKINDAFKELTFPKNSTAGKMKNIFEHLLSKYKKVTVWNLESLLLAPEHFANIFSNSTSTETLYTLTTPQSRLILLSYNLENIDDIKEIKTSNETITAIYNLKSIQEIIYNFSTINSQRSKVRAEDLSNAIQIIQKNLL